MPGGDARGCALIGWNNEGLGESRCEPAIAHLAQAAAARRSLAETRFSLVCFARGVMLKELHSLHGRRGEIARSIRPSEFIPTLEGLGRSVIDEPTAAAYCY